MYAAPGFFVENVGSASQQACELGYYQPNSGWLSCLMADPGNYVDTLAATAQITCEAGTYNPNSGSTTAFACLDAEPGNYVPDQPLPHRYPVKRVVIKIRGNRQNANQLVWDTS